MNGMENINNGVKCQVMTGAYTLQESDPFFFAIDAGAARDFVLPTRAARGRVQWFTNGSNGAETITFKDDADSPNTLGTLAQNQSAIYGQRADNGAWYEVAKWTTTAQVPAPPA